ncbi:MAG: hypothetical protein AB8G18_03920 [Gammaproteobacteria bacterium]
MSVSSHQTPGELTDLTPNPLTSDGAYQRDWSEHVSLIATAVSGPGNNRT